MIMKLNAVRMFLATTAAAMMVITGAEDVNPSNRVLETNQQCVLRVSSAGFPYGTVFIITTKHILFVAFSFFYHRVECGDRMCCTRWNFLRRL